MYNLESGNPSMGSSGVMDSMDLVVITTRASWAAAADLPGIWIAINGPRGLLQRLTGRRGRLELKHWSARITRRSAEIRFVCSGARQKNVS